MTAGITSPFPQDELIIRPLSYDDPVVRALEAELQQEYLNRYGGEDEAPVDPDQFGPPDGAFLVGFVGTEPVASGGFRRHDDEVAEIKRMYVDVDHRGAGYARKLLHELETRAHNVGYRRIVLEIGLKQPEAIALYESSGYFRVSGFGVHQDSELVRFLGKDLAPVS